MTEKNLTFRCLNLTNNSEIIPFFELFNSINNGFHSLYTHASIISGMRESVSGVGLPESFDVSTLFRTQSYPSLC